MGLISPFKPGVGSALVFVVLLAVILLAVYFTRATKPRVMVIAYDPARPLPADIRKLLIKYQNEGATVTFKDSDFDAGLSHIEGQ